MTFPIGKTEEQATKLCDVCEQNVAVVGCEDGKYHCFDCCMEDGYDPATGQPFNDDVADEDEGDEDNSD
jgi:hypothetical protein